MILKTSAKWDLEDYLMEWSRKLKAFNRMVKIKKLFNEKGQQFSEITPDWIDYYVIFLKNKNSV